MDATTSYIVLLTFLPSPSLSTNTFELLFFPPFRKLSALTSSSVRHRPRLFSRALCVVYQLMSRVPLSLHLPPTMAAAAAISPVLAILGNFSQDPLPAVFVAVGGLVVLKFTLGVSGRYEIIWYLIGNDMHFILSHAIAFLCPHLSAHYHANVGSWRILQVPTSSLCETHQMRQVRHRYRRYRRHWSGIRTRPCQTRHVAHPHLTDRIQTERCCLRNRFQEIFWC